MVKEQLIEIEIQKRVGFRLEEIRKQFKMGLDAAKMADRVTFGHLHARGFLMAYEIVNDVLEKELSMGTPLDGDFNRRVWLKKEKAVNDISNRILKQGTRDYMHLKSFINNQIEHLIDD